MVCYTASIICEMRYALALSRDRYNREPVPDMLVMAVDLSDPVPIEDDLSCTDDCVPVCEIGGRAEGPLCAKLSNLCLAC